jgi:hypothetical protein
VQDLRPAAEGAPVRPRFAVLALDGAQNDFPRSHVSTVAVEHFVAAGEALEIDNQRQHPLQTVGPVIARVSALHHRIARGGAFHIRAGQVVQDHLELALTQLAIALLKMLFQLGLLWQNAIQPPITTVCR